MKPVLLSILPRPPHPTRDGLAIRNYHLLRALAGEFRVRALVLRAPHLPEGEYPNGVEAEEFPQSVRAIRRAWAASASLLSGAAYSPLLYRSRHLTRAVLKRASAEKPAWLFAHSYHVAPHTLTAGSRSWIDFHNLDSQIWERIGVTAPSLPRRLFATLQAPRIASLEARLAESASGLSCVSESDAAALQVAAPSSRPLVVPNGVDLSRYTMRESPAPGKIVFFVGDLSWPPNAQGIAWFRKEIWPLVRRAHPDARAQILGREPPADLAAISSPDFHLLGEGGDTRPHWREAAVGVVPLQAGGGTRLKILEAAACGVPIVSTSVGAEGLEFERGSEILIADDAPGFAAAIGNLLGDAPRSASLAKAARVRVESLYDWTEIGSKLVAELLARTA